MTKYKISKAFPCYTGGGIYIYLGELADGRGFVAYDLAVGEVGGIAITPEFQENYFDDDYELQDHVITELDDESENAFDFWNAMIDWIIKNKPQNDYCNYQMYDIEERKAGKVG